MESRSIFSSSSSLGVGVLSVIVEAERPLLEDFYKIVVEKLCLEVIFAQEDDFSKMSENEIQF